MLRFLFSVTSQTGRKLDTWVAVPRNSSSVSHLFSQRHDDARIFVPSSESSDVKERVESLIWRTCDALTIGQRCADWFILRQFRVSGTNASNILSTSNDVRHCLGMENETRDTYILPSVLFDTLVSAWFNSMCLAEPMKRGTANESAVLKAISKKKFVAGLFECGMLARKGCNWWVCSPDGVLLLNLKETSFLNTVGTEGQARNDEVLASIEIKTGVADSALSRAGELATAEYVFCHVGDAICQNYVPDDHLFQIFHQRIVLSRNYSVYVVASETGILMTVVMTCSTEKLISCGETLRIIAAPLVSWAHEDSQILPPFAPAATKKLIKHHLPFWTTINKTVRQRGAFPPIKRFKHGIQSLYSNTKGGLDGSAQARAVLRSSTSSLRWEQKLVTQTFKTLRVNAFIAWRMSVKRELLASHSRFGGLDRYRQVLNSVQYLADFSLDASRELLSFANKLAKDAAVLDTEPGENERIVAAPVPQRLPLLAKNRK